MDVGEEVLFEGFRFPPTTGLVEELPVATLLELATKVSSEKGQYQHCACVALILRAQGEPVRFLNYWQTSAVDRTGAGCVVQLYNFDVSERVLNRRLKAGQFLAVKGPVLKGSYSTIIGFHATDIKLPNFYLLKAHNLWPNLPVEDPRPVTLRDVAGPLTCALADRLLRKGREPAARFIYLDLLAREGLEALSWEGRLALGNNFSQSRRYEEALTVLNGEGFEVSQKLVCPVRQARADALTGLRQFGQALETISEKGRRCPYTRRVNESRGDIGSISDLRSQVSREQTLALADFISPLHCRPILNRGNGTVALQDVSQGYILMACKALAHGEDHTQSRAGRQATVAELVTELAARNPRTFGADGLGRLCGWTGNLCPSDWREQVDAFQIRDVCAENMFALDDVENEIAWILSKAQPSTALNNSALFLAPSLINHSCLPNCFRVHVGDVVLIRASRAIRAGEELTVSYVPVDSSQSDRKASLARWGFVCTCPRCQFVDFSEIRDQVQTMNTLCSSLSTRPKGSLKAAEKVASSLIAACETLKIHLQRTMCDGVVKLGYEDLSYYFHCAAIYATRAGLWEEAADCWEWTLSILGYELNQSLQRMEINARFIEPSVALALEQLSFAYAALKRDDKSLKAHELFKRVFVMLGGSLEELSYRDSPENLNSSDG